MHEVAAWTIEQKEIEILHETGRSGDEARWEYRVDGEVRMYGHGTPDSAREAVSTRRKLQYRS